MKPFPVDRSREFWTPDKAWLGDTVFILGGGDSLRGFDCSPLRNFGWILTINSSYWTAPFCDALYFNDHTWWSQPRVAGGPARRVELCKSKCTLITTSRAVKREAPDRVHRIYTMSGVPFRVGSGPVRQGRSSGHTAISLAAARGGKRLILLGYDMRIVGGRSHHHNEYSTNNDKLYSRDFIPAFQGWNEVAVKCGVQVLNATPGSALKEFPRVNLEDVLR